MERSARRAKPERAGSWPRAPACATWWSSCTRPRSSTPGRRCLPAFLLTSDLAETHQQPPRERRVVEQRREVPTDERHGREVGGRGHRRRSRAAVDEAHRTEGASVERRRLPGAVLRYHGGPFYGRERAHAG